MMNGGREENMGKKKKGARREEAGCVFFRF